MKSIAVIIPAYNEELTIQETITDCYRHLPEAQIFVIDNNSADKTNQIALSTINKLGCQGTVMFEKKQGKALAIRKAFAEIDADVYVMIDADLTYQARDIKKLLEPVLSGTADMAVGDRHADGGYKKENKRIFHQTGNQTVKFLVNTLFNSSLNDIMSGFRAFNRYFVKNYPIMCAGFELETEMSIHALDKRFNIAEVPIEYKDRPQGSVSKLNTFEDGMKVIRTLFIIFKDYRPLLFFSFFAAIFTVLALLIGMPVIIEFIKTKYILRVPSAILATGFAIIALLSLSVGFVLDTVVKLNNHDYELRLILSGKKHQ